MANTQIKEILNYYKTAYANGTTLTIISTSSILIFPPPIIEDNYIDSYGIQNGTITVVSPSGQTITITDIKESQDIVLFSGTYQIRYAGQTYHSVIVNGGGQGSGTTYQNYSFSFYISVIENQLPLKKWTITDVLNRLLVLAEPIRQGENPRFRLNAAQAAQFNKILAPEFSFTKQTLRECLQQVGGVIHGEPRLTPVKDYAKLLIRVQTFSNGRSYIGTNNPSPFEESGSYFILLNGTSYSLNIIRESDEENDNFYLEIVGLSTFNGILPVYTMSTDKVWIFEISYDMFASNESSDIQYMAYTDKGQQHVIESYLGWIDSTAENLINQLDKFSGVVVEPYAGGAKSVRTENLYVRIEEDNMLIPTQYPIYTIEKLEYVYETDGQLQSVDITPYVFEKSEYDGRLSSYDGAYPYSKMYALYFTQGGKNIAGLNFKAPAASSASGAFKEYAITNILREATGNNSLTLNYPTMCFRVTYTPFYNARVGQTKANYKDFKRPAALIYNQQSNVIESRAYGENLKGAAARLGNTEVSLTYSLRTLSEIPVAGLKFNKNYYISAVATAIYPTLIKSTIGLSKDFNRISQYIGVSSVKRYYEVSRTQAVERNTLYREYVVIGNQETPDEDTLTGNRMLELIAALFSPPSTALGPVTNVVAWGSSYKGDSNTVVNLPVISSAFGNSISFSWTYEDNYSAGAFAQYQSNGNISGYFQQSLPYGDYYGRLYYYNFDLQFAGQAPTVANYEQIGQSLPKGNIPSASSGIVSTIGKTPYVMRKDSREALQVNFQLDFVTNLENMIIGSALASYCPAVRGTDASLQPRLYVFPDELNKFTDHVEAFQNIKLSDLPSVPVNVSVQNGYLVINAGAMPANGKSWAIVTAQSENTFPVESEDGGQTTQTTYFGGDLLIGQNIEVVSGQAFAPIYFTLKREIFDKSVWKDIL